MKSNPERVMLSRWRMRPLPEAFAVAVACGWFALYVAGSAGAVGGTSKPVSSTVVIESFKYEPGAMTVRRGDTVVWVNKDLLPHTVTARGRFDSRIIAAGASWKYVAREKGTFSYLCALHPNMRGTLIVE